MGVEARKSGESRHLRLGHDTVYSQKILSIKKIVKTKTTKSKDKYDSKKLTYFTIYAWSRDRSR